MFNNQSYWYDNINSSTYLPPIAVKKSVRESKKWKKAMLDGLERIAIEQFDENQKFVDYYRMVDGEMSFQELKEAIPQLSDTQDLLDGVGIPSFLKHYDLIGIIVNALVGILIDQKEIFHVIDTGEVAESEYIREKTKKLRELITEKIQAGINIALAEAGIDPEKADFQSEEEQQQYIAEMQKVIDGNTPKDLQEELNKKFKTKGVQWANATLDQDAEKFDEDKLDKDNFKDLLLTGRCFRHYKVNFDSYYPENWSPINTFFSQTLDVTYPQKGQYVGRVHFFSPTDVINRYGEYLDSKQQKDLLSGNEDWQNFVMEDRPGGISSSIQSNFNTRYTVPHANYFDYNYALNLQDTLGVPLGVYTDYRTGEERDRYLPHRFNDQNYINTRRQQSLRTDLRLRDDLCQVLEVYTIVYELIGFLTYENEFGGVETAEVTEDILPEFIKEKGIKQSFTQTLMDIKEGFEVNTLKWYYRPVCYEGLKIKSPNLNKDIYVYLKPCEYQIKGDSNIFEVQLPVSGYVGKSFAKKIAPYQAGYNLAMNQTYSLMEKEMGKLFLLDVAFIPSEFGEWGDAEEALVHLKNVAKDVGILPVATTGDSKRDQNTFNQFAQYDLTNTSQIATRRDMAEYYKNKAYEAIGINGSLLGSPTKYETAEGVKVSNNASMAQLAEIFKEFSSYRKHTLALHLNIAQYCQGDGKDLSLMSTKSDSSIQFLKLTDPEFPLRRLGLIPSADNKKKKELETLKQQILQTNTLGNDILDLAELVGSDSYSEAIEMARISRKRAQEAVQQKQQADRQNIELQNKLDEERAEKEYQRQEISKDKDRQVKLEDARIEALGRALDEDATGRTTDAINKEADRAQRQLKMDSDIDVNIQNIKLKEKKITEDSKLRVEQLKLKAEELKLKRERMQADKYIATINKN